MNEANQSGELGSPPEAALLLAALRLTGPDRVAFLDRASRGDAGLRKRLDTLLATYEESQGLPANAEPAARGTMKVELADIPDEIVGQKIGRYKILEKVGEGGCGVVYVAEQTEPVRRRVALKIIKLGMDTRQLVARFEAERQALAMMDHPNIAKVLDAGATDSGRPYFVMELVRGIKITDYCDQNKLPTNERLELFIKICQAIQHAHQKGIIHRDIKPSNILVTLHDGAPVPKVIDFGIAKAITDQRLTDKTLYTQLQQFIGTPAYMSPEQAEMSGLDVDTRSDIYSLGVLLYELLTGSTPFDIKELMAQGIDAMRKTIRERNPLRPSTKLATLKGEELTTTAKRRSVEISKLAKLLAGDLDWIVMKCLEKDRTRRYETANGLAMDLNRHLNNETVVARPPSKLYEFQRTFRRHKVGIVATAAIFVVLAIGIIMTSWQAVRATRAKQDAMGARRQAVANEEKAVAAEAGEVQLRRQAQAGELAARQRAYASDMNAAMQAIQEDNAGQTLDLLNRQINTSAEADLRGWEWRYLWRQIRGDALFTLCQKLGQIESVTASSDGDFLAVGTAHKGGVSVWDLRTRLEVASLAENGMQIRAAFSPAEPLLAFTSVSVPTSGTAQSTLHLWNAATRQMVADIPLDGPCDGLAFSRDGKTLVTGVQNALSMGGHIALWHVPDGSRLASYPTPLNVITPTTAFAATPDLKLAAYAEGPSNPQNVRVVDLRDGKELWTAVASPDYVTALAFSPDGKTLATADGFGESDIFLWDVATGTKIGQLKGHGSWVGSLVFWPDGKKLASASADQTIRVWDVPTRECLNVLRGNRSEVWRLALLPDQKTLVSGAKDGTVCSWDASVTHPRQENITWPVNILAWTFAPNSRSVLTLDVNGQVAQWSGADFHEKEPLFEMGTNVIEFFPACHFSRDGRFLAVGSGNGILSVWDVSRRLLLRQVTNGAAFVAPMSFVANGNELVTASSSDGMFHEWDLTTGLETQSWPSPVPFNAGHGAVALSPDEQQFAAIGWEGGLIRRDLTGENTAKLPLDVLEAPAAAFSPDGKLFAVASELGFAQVWDAKTWKELATLGGFVLAAHSVGFSPDGKRLATGGGAGAQAIKLWSTESWENVITLPGSGSVFYEPSFSPDGNSLGALSEVGILNVWRAPSWDEIHAAEASEKAPGS